MAEQFTVGDLVAELIALCNVSTVFGVASVHNLPMLDAIGKRNDIRFVMARGEMGAAHMADGFARVTAGLGVVISSTGPGAANAVGGLVEARFAASPVLHITSQTVSKYLDRRMGLVHDAYDQLAMLGAVSKSAYRVRSPEHALGILTRAAVDALTPPMGPVSVEIPIDIQRMPIPRPALFDHFVLPLPPPRPPAEAELDALAARMAAARRPLLWLGAGARGTRESALALLGMGCNMVSSWQGRGIVPDDHPQSLAGLSGNGLPVVQDFYRTVDLMLVVGSRLRGHELGEFGVRLPDDTVQIDIDPMANGRTGPNTLFVCADAALTLAALVPKLRGRMAIDPAYAADFAETRRAAYAAFLGSLGPYGTFMEQLRPVMPRHAVWVRDITQSTSTWGNRIFPTDDPRLNVYPVSAGIGQGLPLGIGAAAAANGRKAVLLTGDGGFFLNVGELWTAIQEGLNLTVIVMNDSGYGVIKKLQDTLHGGRRVFADLRNPDFAGLSALAGIPFWRVRRAEEFGAVVGEALKSAGPGLVEVDMNGIGEFPAYFPFKPRATA